MSRVLSLTTRRLVSGAACVAVLLVGATAAFAQPAAASDGTAGRIRFDNADLPPATVEIDVEQSMFNDLFGLGDAALSGVAESLLQSANKDGNAEGVKMAAGQLQAARQILNLASEVVHEVRVRVYEDLPNERGQAASLVTTYDDQLREGNWDTIVRVRDGDDSVRVSLLRNDGAVQGVFVVAADGSDLVLANVVCDASPENVKKLTSAAAKVGLENGLDQAIEAKMRHLHGHMPPAGPHNGEAGDAR